MNDNNRIRVGVRTKFSSDGAIWEVIETTNVPDGEIVAVNGDHVRRMTLSQLLHDSRHRFIPTDATSAEEDHRETAALILGQLSPERLREVRDRAEHVREVLTGYRSGSAELPRPDEPRPQYDPALPLSARYEAKAAELQTSDRTVKRWVADFRRFGEAGLSDCRYTREPGIDPRWEAEALAVMADYTDLSRPTRSAVIRRTNRNCDERHGVGVVPIPSRAMAYRILAALEPRHPLFRLSTKRNRDADQRPDRPYGKLPCTHPGEYVYLDTTPLDVFAMDPLTLRWVAVELTVVMDRYTRCIIALMLTAVSTKAVDIASLLYQCQRPRPAGAHWPPHAVWPEHGMPRCIFIDPTAIEGPRKGVAGPAVVPETIIVDHGKVFVSEHVTSACARLGISIQPARIREGRDKGPVERFFKTIRQDLLQHLDGYKGPDVHSRGLDVEKRAFYYIDELEEIIREWVAAVYHHRPHGGADRTGAAVGGVHTGDHVPPWARPGRLHRGLPRSRSGLRVPRGRPAHHSALRGPTQEPDLPRPDPQRALRADEPVYGEVQGQVAALRRCQRRPLRLLPPSQRSHLAQVDVGPRRRPHHAHGRGGAGVRAQTGLPTPPIRRSSSGPRGTPDPMGGRKCIQCRRTAHRHQHGPRGPAAPQRRRYQGQRRPGRRRPTFGDQTPAAQP